MRKTTCLYIIAGLLCIGMLYPAAASAQMAIMSDEALSDTYATGFSNFSVTGGVANAWFNVNAATYTEIDSMKMGYHDQYDYKNPTPSFGWDQDWTTVKLGQDDSNHLLTEGIYIEAGFTNIDNPATRTLDYVTIGIDKLNGQMSADFNSFSGNIDDGDGTSPEISGHGLNLGNRTLNFVNAAFEFSLSASGVNKGYSMHFTNTTVSP